MNEEDCEIEVILNCPKCATPIIDIVHFEDFVKCPNSKCHFEFRLVITKE